MIGFELVSLSKVVVNLLCIGMGYGVLLFDGLVFSDDFFGMVVILDWFGVSEVVLCIL